MTDFEKILITNCNELEEEGYKPTDVLFYEPVYSAYEHEMMKVMKVMQADIPDNFSLALFIKQSYDLDVHVIGMDHRIGLVHSSMLVYHDPLKGDEP